MSSLIDDEPDGANVPEFSVSELSGAIRRAIEGEFGHVRVRGEVGRVSRPRSGHIYLDLKDDRAVLAGIIWKGVAAGLAAQPEEGMEVVATGRLTTFAGQSRYQIVIEHLAPAGIGALMAMLEKRRRALAAEGLFDETRKRMLPFLPRVIGVVTSPSGAVIRDILHRLSERFPVHVLVWPVAVQGERCAPEVAAALRGFSALPPGGPIPVPDIVIVARGGGSVEDLWGFNEEAVVRAASESAIPVISAVGHETDTTLIDHAADRRAPTPTAAAEMAVPVRAELAAMIADLEARRLRAAETALERRRQRLTDLARALPRPEQILAERRQRLDLAAARLTDPAGLIEARAQALALAASRLAPMLVARTQQARLALTRRTRDLVPARLSERLGNLRERLADRTARLAPLPGRAIGLATDRVTALDRTLRAFGYKATLARGYAVVRGADGTVHARAAGIAPGAALELEFADARLAASAGGTARGPAAPRAASGRARKTPDDGQGSLF